MDLAPYLAQLCASLGASMIYDHSQLTITSRVDPVSVSSEISVSLGLVVTELVINALKHAFPDAGHGHVVVDYVAQDDAWTLAVSDHGVGMPQNSDPITAGLGTSSVQALATQMNSAITTVNAHPGTRVTLSHPGPRDGAARTNIQSGDQLSINVPSRGCCRCRARDMACLTVKRRNEPASVQGCCGGDDPALYRIDKNLVSAASFLHDALLSKPCAGERDDDCQKRIGGMAGNPARRHGAAVDGKRRADGSAVQFCHAL